MYLQKYNRGFGLVEVIVGCAIILIVIVGVYSSFQTLFKTGLSHTEKIQAASLVEEGVEAMRFLRDSGYSSNIAAFSGAGNKYLVYSSNKWQISTTPQYVDGKYLRSVTVYPVYRDTATQRIVVSGQSGSSIDNDIKEVVVSVSWPSSGTTLTRSASTYLSNIFNN